MPNPLFFFEFVRDYLSGRIRDIGSKTGFQRSGTGRAMIQIETMLASFSAGL
jgi:hypothetical protein